MPLLRLKADGLPDHKGDCLGLGFSYGFGGGGASFGLVQHLVRQFMHKSREFFSGRLAGQSKAILRFSVAHAKGGGDAFFELQRDALSNDKIHEAVAVLPGTAGNALGEFGKLFAFRLAHIEDIGGAESYQNGLVLSADVLLGFLILLPANPDHGSENANAAFTLLDLAPELVPRIKASNAGCVRLLPRNFQNVPKALCVKLAHCGEIGGECFRSVPAPTAR